MWLRKVRLVARMKKIEDLATLIPLYLEGSAFAVYNQMGEDDKSDGEKIEAVLTAAFALNRFSAYDQLSQSNWCPGETIDVFLTELRRLAGLAGVDSEEVVLCAFAAFR